jgi:OmpA-OmpF porin, OOP family
MVQKEVVLSLSLIDKDGDGLHRPGAIRSAKEAKMTLRSQLTRAVLLVILVGTGVWMILQVAGMATVPPTPKPPQASISPRTPLEPIPAPAKSTEQKNAPVEKPQPAAQSTPATPATPAPAQNNVSDTEVVLPSLKDLENRKTLPRVVVNAKGQFIVTDPVLFNTGLATLRPTSLPALQKLASVLKQHEDVSLEIAGYTDNLGSETVNKRLSADRASAVKEYLISEGIEASRLSSKGGGSDDPIASNDTQAGRQANRRIEFRVTSSK